MNSSAIVVHQDSPKRVWAMMARSKRSKGRSWDCNPRRGFSGAIGEAGRPPVLESLRDSDAAEVRSTPTNDSGRRPKRARSWSRSRERSSFSSRAARRVLPSHEAAYDHGAAGAVPCHRGRGSDGTAVERHGGLGRSVIGRQFPPPGATPVPSYG